MPCPHRLGADILGVLCKPLFPLSADVALAHHERWKGRGYSVGLAGEPTAWSGRSVAIVDFLDALTMDRCYRPAFSDKRAPQMLVQQRRIGFDPNLVDACLARAPAMTHLRDRVDACPPCLSNPADDTAVAPEPLYWVRGA